jgi:hypothetical protein
MYRDRSVTERPDLVGEAGQPLVRRVDLVAPDDRLNDVVVEEP